MLKLGFAVSNEGKTYNIIGESKDTEGGARMVIVQEFGQKKRGQLRHIAHKDWVDVWKKTLRTLKSFDRPIVHGIPPQLPDWLPPGRYRHFKGGVYNCIGVSLPMDKSGEPVMVYQSLYGKHIYQLAHRSYSMYTEHVVKPEYDYEGPRFTLVKKCAIPFIAPKSPR